MYYRVSILFFISSLVVFLSIKTTLIEKQNAYYKGLEYSVIADIQYPIEISQESINTALLAYSIKTTPWCDKVNVDFRLRDRGLTTKHPWNTNYEVKVGVSSFENWSVLASTLAHELEVHCNQNFLLINVLDSLGLDGTGFAERVAYNYEIVNSERFGLSKSEIKSLIKIKDKYYPYLSEVKNNNQEEDILEVNYNDKNKSYSYRYLENFFTQIFNLSI